MCSVGMTGCEVKHALEGLAHFREEAFFATWISRIAVNTALKVLRKRKGLATVPLQTEEERGEGREKNEEGVGG